MKEYYATLSFHRPKPDTIGFYAAFYIDYNFSNEPPPWKLEPIQRKAKHFIYTVKDWCDENLPHDDYTIEDRGIGIVVGVYDEGTATAFKLRWL